jgi:hypothetical protein
MAERGEMVDLQFLKKARNTSIGLATSLVPISILVASNPYTCRFVYIPSVLAIVSIVASLNFDSKIEKVIRENETNN